MIDNQTKIDLDDHWVAAMTVGVDGSIWPWLFSPHDAHAARFADDPPEHERLGRLPKAIRSRLYPCHAVAKSTRQPCTVPARPGSDYCAHHRRAEQTITTTTKETATP